MDVYNKPKIADVYKDFFASIGQNLASQIPKSSKTFEIYINKVNIIIESKPLSINVLKDAFILLKISKSLGVDDVSFNIIKKCFTMLCEPFNLPISAISWKGGISRWFKNYKSDSNP